MSSEKHYARIIKPNSFDQENHFFQKALSSQLNSIVNDFLYLGNERIVSRYCHMNPSVHADKLKELLFSKPTHFLWGGADLFNVTTLEGSKKMILIEANSCPSGIKSMPLLQDHDELGAYRSLVEHTFLPFMNEQIKAGKVLKDGVLAVLYDKNEMETSGYAAAIAEILDEDVFLVECIEEDEQCFRYDENNVLQVKTEDGQWHKVRIAFRFIYEKPWRFVPLLSSKTLIVNPMIACVSGGRNKIIAAKAYELLNAEYSDYGIRIITPSTIHDVLKPAIPLWVQSMGGFAVVKNPYSNAGQGVYTITSKKELDQFMQKTYDYEMFIVENLIGNYKWQPQNITNQFFHVGTVPDKNKKIYVADLRMLVHYNYTKKAWMPLALYGRRAAKELSDSPPEERSWEQLGTNLSVRNDDGTWITDTKRLIVAAVSSFNKLGMGVDDLINAYIQSVLACIAIDRLSSRLLHDGKFEKEMFQSLSKDKKFLDEILF